MTDFEKISVIKCYIYCFCQMDADVYDYDKEGATLFGRGAYCVQMIIIQCYGNAVFPKDMSLRKCFKHK